MELGVKYPPCCDILSLGSSVNARRCVIAPNRVIAILLAELTDRFRKALAPEQILVSWRTSRKKFKEKK